MAKINGKDIVFSPNVHIGGSAADTFYANDSDYAVCFEWSDGNPSKENRLNRFVQLTDGGNKISFANSTADICGVTTDTAGFVENYGVYSEYTSFVGILGIVTVIDNGSCTVGDCCMSDDNGYAVPSSNNMGYRVMARVSANKIKVAVKPNDDMIQRIRTDITELDLEVNQLNGTVDGMGRQVGANSTAISDINGEVSELKEEIVNKINKKKKCEVVKPFRTYSQIDNCGVGNTICFSKNSYRRVFLFEINKIHNPKGLYIEGFGANNILYAICDENDIVLYFRSNNNTREADYINFEEFTNAKKIYVVSTYYQLVGFYYYEDKKIYEGDIIPFTDNNSLKKTDCIICNRKSYILNANATYTFTFDKKVCRNFGIWLKCQTYEDSQKITNISVVAYSGENIASRHSTTSKNLLQIAEWSFTKFYLGDIHNEIDKITITVNSDEQIKFFISDFLIVNKFYKPTIIFNFDSFWKATDDCGAYDYFYNNNIPITVTGKFSNNITDEVKNKLLNYHKNGLIEIGIYGNEQRETNTIDVGVKSFNSIFQRLNNIIDSKIQEGVYPKSFGGGQHYITPQIKKALELCNFTSIRCGDGFGENLSECIDKKYVYFCSTYQNCIRLGGTFMYFTHGISSNPNNESDPNLYTNFNIIKQWIDEAIALRNKGGLDFCSMSNYVENLTYYETYQN